MNILYRPSIKPYGAIAVALSLVFIAIFAAQSVRAESGNNKPKDGQRLITIHDNGEEKTILTSATTLRDAFSEANVPLDKNDLVEPGLDEKLVAKNYETNIYRARPVIIEDGQLRQKVMSAYRTSGQIVAQANMQLHDEDVTTLGRTTDIVSDGSGIMLKINRATKFTLVLYGKKSTAYSQATTVGQMLRDKDIVLKDKDTLSVKKTAPLESEMTIELWRNGKQTISKKKTIAFQVEQIQDADRPVGYKRIKTPGVNGEKTVSYEITMKNGKEKSRKEIRSVVTKQPKKQVEIVGAKPTFGGDFAAALAKLRSCEGGYSSINPAGPYYGAYQFDRQTWGTVADPGTFLNASPAQQDAAARALYERRGWSPWPSCGAGLPDTFR